MAVTKTKRRKGAEGAKTKLKSLNTREESNNFSWVRKEEEEKWKFPDQVSIADFKVNFGGTS